MYKNMIIRLDDASDKMNTKNWDRIEKILDSYNIKPIVGIIPINKDPDFQHYSTDNNFKQKLKNWEIKGWYIAMHGYEHIFETNEGGINPVNQKSEFAGLDLETQRKKIKKGYHLLKTMGIEPKIFFAPAHTFDANTIEALRIETNIRIISDTIANDIYFKDDFYYIPQQSGKCRNLPFKTNTFCYHPNSMKANDFIELNSFLKKYKEHFQEIKLTKRKINIYDKIINWLYFLRKNNSK